MAIEGTPAMAALTMLITAVRRRLGRRGKTGRVGARRVGLALLLLAGLACLLHGLWIPAKAVLAQGLLERSWSRTVISGVAEPPWPWADTWPVARLRAPGHGFDQVVLEGASGNVLAFAPGRFRWHDNPSPSAETARGAHTVIAGHRDTHFRFLEKVQAGDPLEVQGQDGSRRHYRVSWMRVVDHRDLGVLDSEGEALTLVTCWPFNAVVPGGPLRYVVRAEPIG